ncbi:phosphate transport system regulatory protein PhoU [Salinigranum rubrum]|uniref:Phosphate-specific transport system accessory protein PhoU n=1 Tax=Salinigranum rubrum TaxID=755307 RepID=A0A2I8VM81_9EURY|nr:phosphate signaling complex protein PhoU [Salinigranum rubrum]AUV83028.1 phosphate transport system regulatory protein PhoU [Salinigranum rubrum]
MARQAYQSRLQGLRDEVLYMGELVAEQLRSGFDALEEKDGELAQAVIDGDEEINELYLELEQECIDLIALQQPVAGDLRFIASSFKIITDLERIGDLATNLGGYALQAEHEAYPEVDIRRIGDETLEMLEQAMSAYANEDVDGCYAISEHDDEVDAMCQAASQTVVRSLLEADSLDQDVDETYQDVSRLFLTIRDLERVGDHAVNIAARTLYMVEQNDELLY